MGPGDEANFTGERSKITEEKGALEGVASNDKRGASAQYGEVTQNTDIIRTAYVYTKV